MQYKCGTDCTPTLVISPKFSLSMWVKPTSSSGTLFSKQNNTAPYTKSVSLELDSKYLRLNLDIPGYTGSTSSCALNDDWNFVAVSTSIDSTPEFRAFIQVNTTCSDFLSIGPNWLEDFQDNYYLVVGAALSGANTFTDFFSGFIWDARLYNSQKDTYSLVQSSGCKTCNHCPIENSDECLPVCGITDYWNSTDCNTCNSECTKGCVNDQSCNLCADQLCKVCSEFQTWTCSECVLNARGSPCECQEGYFAEVSQCTECHYSCKTCNGPNKNNCTSCENSYLKSDGTCHFCSDGTYLDQTTCVNCPQLCATCTDQSNCLTCVENGFLNSNNTCECGIGFQKNQSSCVENYFHASVEVSQNNKLTLSFTEDLQKNLSTSDYRILIEDLDFTVGMERKNNRTLMIDLVTEEKIPQDKPFTLEFYNSSAIVSTNKEVLYEESLKGTLNEYDPYSGKTKQAIKVSEAATLIVLGIALAASFLNPNPAGLWSVVNTLQILSYIPIAAYSLSPMLYGFFRAMKDIIPVPNVFEYILDGNSFKNQHKSSYDYGLESSYIFLTTGESLTMLLGVLLLLPFIWMFSKCGFRRIRRFFAKTLREYRYGVMVRFWIEAFLEVCVGCTIQLLNIPSLDALPLLSYIVAGVLTLMIVITPVCVFEFIRRKKNEIVQSSAESHFYKVWSSLFYEFKVDEDSYAKYLYTFFTLKRITYALSIIMLNDYKIIQAVLNVLIMFLYWLFLAKVKPYSEPILQVSNCVSEIFVCCIFIILPILYSDISDGAKYTLEDLIKYCTFAAMGIQTLASIVIFIKTVVQLIRKRIRNRKEAVESIQQGVRVESEDDAERNIESQEISEEFGRVIEVDTEHKLFDKVMKEGDCEENFEEYKEELQKVESVESRKEIDDEVFENERSLEAPNDADKLVPIEEDPDIQRIKEIFKRQNLK